MGAVRLSASKGFSMGGALTIAVSLLCCWLFELRGAVGGGEELLRKPENVPWLQNFEVMRSKGDGKRCFGLIAGRIYVVKRNVKSVVKKPPRPV